MPKGKNQKLKLIYLMKILLEKTDKNHGVTINEIIGDLRMYDIETTRKGIYSDFDTLRYYGMNIELYKQNKNFYYRWTNRKFEVAELKLLVDAVQSSKFITEKKSRVLIKKLESLTSSYERKELQRQVHVTERVKSMNESIYRGVDEIHVAINENRKIKFHYYKWNIHKKQELKKEGAYYTVSPWALTFDHENYYLIAYDDNEKIIKHFRVDKMLNLKITEVKREGMDLFKHFNIGDYIKMNFNMYSAEEVSVRLICRNDLVGVLIDRFGKEIPILSRNENEFETQVKVTLSNQFLAWVASIGDGIKIIGPEIAVSKMKIMIENLKKTYM